MKTTSVQRSLYRLGAAALLAALSACADPPSPTPTPTATATVVPSPTPTATPTFTPLPTSTPTPTPLPSPTPTPEFCVGRSGWWCDGDDLVTCRDGAEASRQRCPGGCLTMPGGQPDTCDVITPTAPVTPPAPLSPTATAEPCPAPDPPPSTEGCPPPLLAGRRIVSFYGSTGPGLGILGRYDITTTLTLLLEQVQVYRDLDPTVETIPAFHIIATVADANPGEDEDYNHRVSSDSLRLWIDAIHNAGGWAFLDVQAGHSDLDTELDLIEPFLMEPYVFLAVDPEFLMVEEGHVPGTDLGQISGPRINQVQARLEAIARATGQRRILIIHQFDNRMITQKECIVDYPCVDLIWDADGFGGPSAKIGDYNQYRGETGFEYGGFKVFYDYDTPVMTPMEVLGLVPPPTLVIYQ